METVSVVTGTDRQMDGRLLVVEHLLVNSCVVAAALKETHSVSLFIVCTRRVGPQSSARHQNVSEMCRKLFHIDEPVQHIVPQASWTRLCSVSLPLKVCERL